MVLHIRFVRMKATPVEGSRVVFRSASCGMARMLAWRSDDVRSFVLAACAIYFRGCL